MQATSLLSQSETIIGQFNKTEIARILPEIQRQAKTKKDFVIPASTISVDDSGKLSLPGVKSFKLANSGNTYATWQEAEGAAEKGESIIPQEASGDFPLSRTARRQLCTRLGTPIAFVDALCTQGQGDLAGRILTERLHRPRIGIDPANATANVDRFTVRMLDSAVRAVVSERYRIIDNIDLFFASAQKLDKVGGEIWQMRLTGDNFQMLAVARGISGEVRLDRTFDPGDGWQSRWHNGETDTQYAAMSLSNSETGCGSIQICPAIMTRVCANYNVWAKVLRAVHLGRKREEDGLIENAETQSLESRLTFARVQAAIETIFNPDDFAKYIETMNAATQRVIVTDIHNTPTVQKAVERVSERFEIQDNVAATIYANLLKSCDYSQYGMMQATTQAAHDMDVEKEIDGAISLEEIGGAIVHLSNSDWRDLVKA